MNNNSRIVRIRRGQNNNGNNIVEETTEELMAPPNNKNKAAGEEEEFANIPEELRCWVCKKRPITYQPIDCDCAIYCRTCAMKLATAFHCKKCKQMSSGMRRIRRR